MERQLSNVSYHSYQDYQPTRKYGPQYEPGGYATAVQQRTNMTQREDALKFEQGRIKALQEERLHIQKKTFTKWINSFLQKARMEVDDLFVDLSDGRRLLKLLEIISGERLPRPHSGRMRVHKIENVNKSLSFLHTKVRLESIGAEDIVDGNPRLILGLIWTIILRFQIQEIEIDVDEENVSSEKKSAKDALLLWCQRKTSGYHGVHIHNFTDSWRSGLGFNALIHAHRPDLFRWNDLPVADHVETLNHAFEVAHRNLGIPKLLDAEDVDTTRPDEKSVMTYVASYYHTFARMKNEQKSGRRIANIIGQMMDCDDRKAEYGRLVTALLEWIRMKVTELNGRDLPNSLDGIQRLLLAFKQYRTVEKPPKYKERSEIEALYFDINTMQKSLTGEPWAPMDGQLPQDLERAWQKLEQAEHAREIALRTELLRQERLEQLNYKFNTKSVLRKGYLKEMSQVLSDPRYGSNLAQVDATVKKHEAISADILARTERFEDLSAMAAELVREQYHGAEAAARTEQAVLASWRELLALLEGHRASLASLAHLMSLLREADTVGQTLMEMKAQFESEEVGRHLVDVERLATAHALQEGQLGAIQDSLRRLKRQASARAPAPAHANSPPAAQLAQQLATLEEAYDSLVAAAKDRKARLEDARNLFQFLEDHDEEEAWVTDKMHLCRADVAAKDQRGVAALRAKHAALGHELRARDLVAATHRQRGQSLIDAGHPKSGEISRRLSALAQLWEGLRAAAEARDKQLADAAEAHQFYADANEAESWLKEKRPLVATEDCGSDAPSAAALLARHRATHEAVTAYAQEIQALTHAHHTLLEAGITSLQLPTEVESSPAIEEEEWVKESRLVPTEVWEEEPVERLEHRTVTEERSVPQVKALYPFTGQGISVTKGEVMFLMSKTNPDWWSVRKADRSDGFVPANYVREIEPRIVPVQVRRAEKVKTVQRVKKTVLVKQVVPVRRARPARRPSRAPAQPVQASVKDKMADIQKDYDELLQLSHARREQLEDAIKLYSFFAECEDFDKWIREKEKLLRTEESGDTVDTAKRKYEKFVTDLSAASKRLEHIDAAAEELVSTKHPQASKATARRQQLQQQWQRLLRLKQQKEKSLEGASSVELFSRTCDEALDWMKEKERQLSTAGAPAADLRTVRALQRRHAQLERELQPLRQKVHTVSLLADSVKSQYPTEKANVEARQEEIASVWSRCQAAAADRRSRLESAVGHQIFASSSAQLLDWIQKVQEQLAESPPARDVATADQRLELHRELGDDIKAHDDEFKEVISLGRQLVSSQPPAAPGDVAKTLKALEEQQKAVKDGWSAKEAHLQQSLALAAFNREADHVDAASTAHEHSLAYDHCGSSVDETAALLKRHEELEARLAAQDERHAALLARAHALVNKPHFAKEHISSRAEAVSARRAAVRATAAARRQALLRTLQYHQFIAAADELQAWIDDKTKTAEDQSYRDLANLERRLQKHEAFERELQANERQLRNVESMAQSLQQSDPSRQPAVEAKLEALRAAWGALGGASRDKGGKLRQAAAQRQHRRSVEDARLRLSELQRSLQSTEVGTDLRSCRRLLQQHQALEQELSQLQQKAEALTLAGADLVSGGHFDGAAITRESAALTRAVDALPTLAQERRAKLNSSLEVHKFAAEVANELDWVTSRRAAAGSDSLPSTLLAAQSAQKKHVKLKGELAGREPIVERLLAKGKQLADSLPKDGNEKINSLCKQLEEAYSEVCQLAEARASHLEDALKAQQFLHDALEVDSWLADKEAALESADVGNDHHRATQLLTRHKAVELELDTYAAIIAEMGRAAGAVGPAAVSGHQRLAARLQRLQRLAAQRQRALVESVCRHEYLTESAELESWIQEQAAAAGSEDYGQDYEHLQILQSKFEELRHRVESGAERFNQCEELAKKLLATDSPHIADIERRQEALGDSWQRLVDQIAARASRLRAAGDIHRFHRDASELCARAAERRAQLSVSKAAPAPQLLREHDAQHAELVAIDAQAQVLLDEGSRLSTLCPGGNAAQIGAACHALTEAAAALKAAASRKRQQLLGEVRLHQFNTQVRDLIQWSSALRAQLSAPVRVRDAASAQTARADHDAARADIDTRDSSCRDVLQFGHDLMEDGHPNSQEIEEKCNQLVEERSKLLGAWAARTVALDQLIDLHCFLRDAKLLHSLCAAQEAALSTEISPTASVEEIDNQLKKHEAFEKLLATQDEKLSVLNSHGAKLLAQAHADSPRIAEELKLVNERRKKLHELCAARHASLSLALSRSRWARDAGEARGWLAGRRAKLQTQHPHGEVTNLEDKIKKLQKHQAFTAELAANRPRLQEIQQLAGKLPRDEHLDTQLRELETEWQMLEEATEQRGRGLEEAQDILEFNQQMETVEAWIREKENMVQANELGRDYEHCAALERKLDGLDSGHRVDDQRVQEVCALADKLLQQGPSQEADAVSSRRAALVSRWRALSGALKDYRRRLAAAATRHEHTRDVHETLSRISEKAAVFASSEKGRSLRAAEDLQRRLRAAQQEAAPLAQRIQTLGTQAKEMIKLHPDHKEEIQSDIQSLEGAWSKLQHLAAKRAETLEEAIAEHKFEENLKELELWVSSAVERMRAAEQPDSEPAAREALQLHDETKTEIDGRKKAIAALLAETQDPARRQRLEALDHALTRGWERRLVRLTQDHLLQQFKEQARLTEAWLEEKEAFLNNDDLGENLDAVEALIRKHDEFSKVVGGQADRVEALKKTASALIGDESRKVLDEEDPLPHAEYVKQRLQAVLRRTEKLKESCVSRGAILAQSRQLQQFVLDLRHEREWIQEKMQLATDQNYRELSNLQSKIQKHSAFESELAAHKARVDGVAARGEELIEKEHYAAKEIATHVEELENQWRDLQSAAKSRREHLAQAYQARVFLRGADDFTAWLDDVEGQLLSEDHGTDLATVTALLRRHARLEAAAAQHADLAASLIDTARQLHDTGHFLGDHMLDQAETAVNRYRQLQEPMQIRRDNLEDAEMLHRWNRDADEEIRWLGEREALLKSQELPASLPDTQAQLKKMLALEAELIAREPSVSSVVSRAHELSRRPAPRGAPPCDRGGALQAQHRGARARASDRVTALRERVEMLMLLQEISEAEDFLSERRSALVSPDVGRDEESVLALGRRLDALQQQLLVFRGTMARLEEAAGGLAERADGELVSKRLEELKTAFEEMNLLTARRQQRLQQSLKYFKFVRECSEVEEWVGEQMSAAASEEYGLDAEHVDALQQAFDHFLAQLHASEGRVETAVEAGAALLEENAPEADRVKRRIDDLRGLWDDLKELAAARQEALAGARQVHEFDRNAEETAAWIAAKQHAVADQPRAASARSLTALQSDLAAIRTQHDKLVVEADRLGAAFPDAKEHVSSKLEDVTEALQALETSAIRCSQQLELAEQLQAYFDKYQELIAWCSEMLARVTAAELAGDVAGGERLLARHSDLRAEILARDDAFNTLYSDGEKLVREGHFMSGEISERMATLRARRAALQSAWDVRQDIYERHLDALIFKRDADALDHWITTRVPLVRDGKVGDSIAAAEELLARHQDLEAAIAAQQDRFQALRRITLVEKAFKEQQEQEAEARKRSAAAQEQERLQQYRRDEVQRIVEERRKDAPERQLSSTLSERAESEETLSPAPQFERLPREGAAAAGSPAASTPGTGVKRAESMSVVKSAKRTPSFTTRRRTQSFRRHRRPDAALPPVEIQGFLERKQECGSGGSRAAVRSWRTFYSVLCGQLLAFFRDEDDFHSSKAAAPPIVILNAKCVPAHDYTKRAHVFRVSCADGAEFLFACSEGNTMREWIAKLAFHAQLPPALQLTPYDGDEDVRKRLRNASSSSSARSSPDTTRRREQRDSKIESSVLPSQPARSPPPPPAEIRQLESSRLSNVDPRQSEGSRLSNVELRQSEGVGAAWGRSRFSNGRDVNADFIRSQKEASGPPVPTGTSGQSGPLGPPPIPERTDKQSVTALVNNYQRMARSYEKDANKNPVERNTNWERVETSHFYSASDIAYGGQVRPASVAGSGGSPALDNRPASRSSGESELSVSGVSTREKKDKKGVFGGLFSRKKRPQSHM